MTLKEGLSTPFGFRVRRRYQTNSYVRVLATV